MIEIIKRNGAFIIALFVLFFYLGTITFAAEKDGDFVHMWVAGRTISLGFNNDLYNPEVHYSILEQSRVEAEEFWGERYDILGVFFYPPPTGILYASIGWLNLYQAQLFMAGINIAIGTAAAYLLFKLLENRLSFSLIFLVLFTFPSFFYNFTLGQNGALTLLVVLASWLLIKNENGRWGGIVLAALIYKPNWLAAIGWVPLIERRWRTITGIIIGLLGIVGLTTLILGPKPFVDYAIILFKIVNLHDLPNYPIDTQYSILAGFRRLLGLGTAASLLGWGLVGLIVAATAWLISIQVKKPAAGSELFLLVAALSWTTATLFNPHLHHYDLMLIPAAALVSLIEWPFLHAPKKLKLLAIVLFNQFAFLLIGISPLLGFGENSLAFLPTLGAILLWGWLFGRIYQKSTLASKS